MAKLDKQALLDKLFSKIERVATDSEILTVDYSEILDEFKVKEVELREGQEGNEYLRLITKKGWINISVGAKLAKNLTKKRGEARIDEIIETGTLYFGFNDREGNERERPWMTFSVAGDSSASILATKNYAEERRGA